MADAITTNGDAATEAALAAAKAADAGGGGDTDGGSAEPRAGDYVRELLHEKQRLDPSLWPNASRLLDQEVTREVARIQGGGRPGARESKYVDIYREKPVRVAVKVLVPIKEHPKFNFVGKLLGPKGNSMKRLQEDTMTKMAVLGRGSMKDKQKEEELRMSMDPKYAHLSDDLHVEIAAFAPPAEAHARIAYALAEVRKYLIPDSNDEIRQEQMREMEMIQTVSGDGGAAGAGGGGGGAARKGAGRGGGGGPWGGRGGGAGGGRGGGGGPPLGRGAARAGLLAPPARPLPAALRKALPPPPPPPPPPALLPRPTPTKTKVLSILDRARAAMEETAYGCDDEAGGTQAFYDASGYDAYGGAGYLPVTHRYGGYDSYDDGSGDYYNSSDVYSGPGSATAASLVLPPAGTAGAEPQAAQAVQAALTAAALPPVSYSVPPPTLIGPAQDDAGCRWKGFKSPAAPVAADRSRFRAAPYTRPTK